MAQGALTINEDLFQNFAGEWKASKNGRGPYMRLLADAIKAPDEIWLHWEESFMEPGKMLLKRRYIKSWVIGEGDDTQYGLSVFEAGKGEWSGSTVMAVKPNRLHEQRRKYIEDQREGFLLYRRRPKAEEVSGQ
ncbi:PBECR2 nuclease fold domain-containing protein [Dentiradicibacter hellwigii]|uniref:PBECR2 nuclease fold domain-containing protein n=1 Tax=Dentiradicibacter hellwigii TaxID=3149053 RepID=A0ABV4UDC8_9RHOO